MSSRINAEAKFRGSISTSRTNLLVGNSRNKEKLQSRGKHVHFIFASDFFETNESKRKAWARLFFSKSSRECGLLTVWMASIKTGFEAWLFLRLSLTHDIARIGFAFQCFFDKLHLSKMCCNEEERIQIGYAQRPRDYLFSN